MEQPSYVDLLMTQTSLGGLQRMLQSWLRYHARPQSLSLVELATHTAPQSLPHVCRLRAEPPAEAGFLARRWRHTADPPAKAGFLAVCASKQRYGERTRRVWDRSHNSNELTSLQFSETRLFVACACVCDRAFVPAFVFSLMRASRSPRARVYQRT